MFDSKRHSLFLTVIKGASVLVCLIITMMGLPALAEDLRCGTSTIRLVCEDRRAEDNECVASHAEFLLDNGKTKIIRTPKGLDASQIPVTADCGTGDGGDYVFIVFSNGGGPGTAVDLFKPDGTALTKNGKYLDKTAAKLHIQSFEYRRVIDLK